MPVERKISLPSSSSIPIGLQILLAVINPMQLSSNSENGEILVTYSPQRLLRHFCCDQGADWVFAGIASMFGTNVWDDESQLNGGCRFMALHVRSLWGALYSVRCVEIFTRFITQIAKSLRCSWVYSNPREGLVPLGDEQL